MRASTIATELQSQTTFSSDLHFRVLEEAHEAITKLKTLKELMSAKDQETLALLIDNELMEQLEKSVQEAENGELKPLSSILE